MPGSSLIPVAGVAPAADRSDVLDRLTTDASTLRAMGLTRCAVFGSFARDQAIHPESDVDLLVTFEPGRKDFDAYLLLVDHLETILARRVDLVTTEGLSRHLAVSVLGEALDVALGA
ncbi:MULTISPECIES: nucleotidyltransferase family protein [unclassified Cyanobium]|uniref:nucleotidyltransferase family protein n=1 Tax=unclassified Cyanobium TaxID=2627006 RepID=UPI0020CE9621|nr:MULTISPECIES: nucleotidyltransferase domain-containing protein [unclassified Cyanobium]MCP9859864.1 nucleotidyltransferase domain-containing protein [Cyanobium sp. Cruz-8H5]MCP9867038.1 nucleotidyltransferase domain-containing protein [Cyanobium sp. Cruz-8D1]